MVLPVELRRGVLGSFPEGLHSGFGAGVRSPAAVGIWIAIGAVDVGCNIVLNTKCSSALERRKRRWTATTCFFVE
jgi:hypothetical protein